MCYFFRHLTGGFISPLLAGLLVLSISACAADSNSVKTADIQQNSVNIRYINLEIVFNFLLNRDQDALELKRKRESLINNLDEIDRKIASAGEERKKELLERRQEIQGKLAALKSDEEYYKEKILNEIDTALGSVSRREEIDFVFNMGEGAVYAKKEYDITERVINEIAGRRKRSAPVSR